MKIKNKTLAISEAAIAIPVKPSTPAMIEITRNVNTHVNIASVAPDTYINNETTNMIKKIRKTTLAISAAARATPVKPSIAAIIDITRNVKTHPSIDNLPDSAQFLS